MLALLAVVFTVGVLPPVLLFVLGWLIKSRLDGANSQ